MKQQHHKKQSEVPPTRPSPSRGEGKGGGGRSQKSEVRKRLSTDSGFTLVELMIAIVISMIVIGATYAIYISQQRSFTAQDQVAEMQSTSKTAFDLMVKEIREVGFGVPESPNINTNPITGSYNTQTVNTINNIGVNSSDALTILGGFRLMGILQNALTIGSTTVNVIYPSSSSTKFDPSTGTTGRHHISFMGLQYAQISSITPVSGTVDTLGLDRGIDKPFPAGTPVYLIEDVTYQIVNDGTTPVLRRTGRVGMPQATITIAENIEDIQFTNTCDANNDGTIAMNELCDLNVPPDGIADRLAVYLLARSARPDPNFLNQGQKVVMDTNNPNIDDLPNANNDSFRRRLWSMSIDYRNTRP